MIATTIEPLHRTVPDFTPEKGFPRSYFQARLYRKSKNEDVERYILMLSLLSSMKSVHIILADDDEDDRAMFEEVITEVHPKVNFQSAQDGEQLMQLLGEEGGLLPDLIFLDLNMPVKNGKECLEEIRSNEKLRNIPVIIYSTSSSSKDIDETFDKGANLYIRKPTSFKELIALAKKVFQLNWKEYIPKSSKVKFVLSAK